ncbi:MAG: chromosome partitioning protein ParA [Bacteroidetes bacterium]|nr:chromosome partitioning protein ParA [Bacteroidota bacterium]
MENKSESNNRSLKVILGILALLLVATAFYTYTLYTDSAARKNELVVEKDKFIKELNVMTEQYDIAIGDNEAANAKLVEARDRIQGLMDSLKVSDNNVKSLFRYKNRFFALKEEMDVLLAENDSLKVENALLAIVLDSTQLQLSESTVFNDSLLAQNTELADIVENAAVLSTAGLKGFGVIVRSSGKLIPTERARRADKIRVCFTVTKNVLVLSGDKEFFVQVLDPNNNVLGLNQEIQFEEKVLNYSLISKFNYESKNLDICEFIDARGDGKFAKGRYVINIFDENNLVSTSEFTLQ